MTEEDFNKKTEKRTKRKKECGERDQQRKRGLEKDPFYTKTMK
jgi:hypothetical protein